MYQWWRKIVKQGEADLLNRKYFLVKIPWITLRIKSLPTCGVYVHIYSYESMGGCIRMDFLIVKVPYMFYIY